ncbi:MAG: ribonuclease E inhibitor RraB [Chitinophagales bacterium]
MGLSDFLKTKQNGNRKYVTEQQLKKNTAMHMQLAPLTMENLRLIDDTAHEELKLEFFFYTNTSEKAEKFAAELVKLNYEVDHGKAGGVKKLFIITGWTTKMKMEDSVVTNWTKEMCELGHQFECDFDGWGTTPNQ